jgi:hypothetical protein
MKKLFRIPGWAGWGALLLTLASCTPRQSETREDRLKWNLATLQGDYESHGHRDPKWDKDAGEALKQFAGIRVRPEDDLETRADLVGYSTESAVNAGCNDPLVKYLYCRYAPGNSTKTLVQRQDEFRLAARDLEKSGYSPVRKFYANVGAAEWLWARRNTNLWPEVRQFRAVALGDLGQALQDKTLPGEEAYQACAAFFQMVERNNRELTNAYATIEKLVFSNRPKWATAYLIKADFYLLYAWRARGNGNADQVTEEGWRLFKERLAVSEQALNRAWALDPKNARTPVLMMQVAEGRQKKRPEMEAWFQRAMKLDSNNYEACHSKLHYLYPQWYGSRDDMLAFGHECVAATNWGGRVPLILADVHNELARSLPAEDQAAYWGLPGVWPDIQAAYEKYSQANPDATRFRYPYAAYAFRCGQWQAFNEQIELLRKTGDDLNVSYFGGKEAFDKLVKIAGPQ